MLGVYHERDKLPKAIQKGLLVSRISKAVFITLVNVTFQNHLVDSDF